MIFTIESGVGPLPLRFGMKSREVKKVIGPPKHKDSNSSNEVREIRDDVFVTFDNEGKVVEIEFLKCANRLQFREHDLFQEKRLPDFLVRLDDVAFECAGTIVFPNLGISTYDDVESGRLISIFSPGRWDMILESCKKYKRKKKKTS